MSDVYGLRLLAKPRVRLAALATVAAVVLLARIGQFVYWTGQPQWAYDFSFYWTAALHLLRGEPIYSAAQLAGPYAPQAQEGFLYPPALAAFVTPLARVFVDPRFANWIWALAGAAILIASVLALVRSEHLDERFPILRGWGRWWLVLAAFAFPPVIDELVVGNVNLLLLGLLTAAWLGIQRGDGRGEDRGGMAVGVAAIVKVFPGLLVLWFLLTRRPLSAAWAVVAAVVVAAVSLPITGLEPWHDYPTVLANLSSTPNAVDALAPMNWLTPLVGFTVARVVVTAIGVALVAWSAWRTTGSRRATGPERAAARVARLASVRTSFGLAVIVAVLVTPALYTSYLTVLVLPLILGLAAGIRLRWLALAYLLMWGGQQGALGDMAWVVNKGFPTAGALLLLWLFLVARPDPTFASVVSGPAPHR